MSTLAKINPNKKKSKKAMSIIIGYVLLITFAAVIGVIVYKWQKTYVPADSINCPEGSSLFIINKTYDCDAETLTFWIKNNGQFAVGGYFIYVKDDPDKELATVDISRNNTDLIDPRLNDLGINGIKLGMGTDPLLSFENDFQSGAIEEETYTLVGVEDIYSIEIVPIRFQVEKNRNIIASCKDVRIKEEVGGAAGCYEECVDDGQACIGRVCGTVMNNCYEEVSCPPECGIGEFCNSAGQCVTPAECEYTCSSLGYICGTWRICGEDINCDNPGCNEGLGEECNSVGKCVIGESTCDGSWNPPETLDVLCDNGDHCLLSCVCESGYVPVGDGSCVASGSGVGCLSYCQTLGLGYTDSTCVGPPGQCKYTFNGDLKTNGDYLCTNPLTPLCCCAPAV